MNEPLMFDRLDFSSILPTRASLRLATRSFFSRLRSISARSRTTRDAHASRAEVLLQSDQIEECASFYERHFGLVRFSQSGRMIGLETETFRLFIDEGPSYGPVLEFFVADVPAAKERLIGEGCTIDQEDSASPRCYVRDPFGLIFNLQEAQGKQGRHSDT